MVVAIYPGSFDPVTMGHLDIVARGAALFERVIVASYAAPSKDLLLTTEERVQ
ncbi:MAG: adenylyltransferase/cytidyltransferase family protein, partial [Chloroflexi bacterium]|nr:adenylyltransferase/cytidyltransferase family protein [Chloroflexota bacterium]